MPKLLPLVLLLLGSSALAQPAPDPEPEALNDDPAPAAVKTEEKPAKPKKPKEKQLGEVEVGGRVFVRQTVFTTDVGEVEAQGALELYHARMEIRYKWQKLLRAVLEVDIVGNPEVKKAWLRIRANDVLAVRAGFMKSPVSIIDMDSAWNLPVADRGVLSDVFDSLGIAGRRTGVEAEWDFLEQLEGTLIAGVFAGDITFAPASELFADKVIVRAQLMGFGAGFEWRAAQNAMLQTKRFWSAMVDYSRTVLLGPGLLRGWAEVMVGSSNRSSNEPATEPTFVAVRGILSYVLGGKVDGAPYVEPFVMVTVLDPDVDIRADGVTELALGVNAGRWDTWRFQLQLGLRDISENTPLRLGKNGENLTDLTYAILQAGVDF
jgi:hypothetical protein